MIGRAGLIVARRQRARAGARTRALPAAISAGLLLLLLLLLPGIANAHAVVYPRTSTPGAYEKYVLRVPNEKNVATTRVEIHFPADVRVIAFSDVPGWTLQVLSDSAKRITGAIWSGSLPPARFVELPFIAVNPKTDARLVWPTFQTYADGERVDWTGPEDAKTPASATEISNAGAGTGSRATLWVALAALVVALVALGMEMRKD